MFSPWMSVSHVHMEKSSHALSNPIIFARPGWHTRLSQSPAALSNLFMNGTYSMRLELDFGVHFACLCSL